MSEKEGGQRGGGGVQRLEKGGCQLVGLQVGYFEVKKLNGPVGGH